MALADEVRDRLTLARIVAEVCWEALVDAYYAADNWLADELEREVFYPTGKLGAVAFIAWWIWPLMLTAVGR